MIDPFAYQRWREGLNNLEKWRQQQSLQDYAAAQQARDRVARWLNKVYSQGRLLEVGCGAGTLSESAFLPSEVEYFGIDPLVLPTYYYKFPFVVGMAEALPFQRGSFGCVLIKDAIDYFPDVRVALHSIACVLEQSGGMLLVTEGGHVDPSRSASFKNLGERLKERNWRGFGVPFWLASKVFSPNLN